MLRIIKFLNRSTTEVQLAFNLPLDDDIGTLNVRVGSNVASISDLSIKSVRIVNTVLSITTSPQEPNALYFVELTSTDSQPFQSSSGEEILQDGKVNKFFFLGIENTNDIRETLIQEAAPTYDFDVNSLPRKFYSTLANTLLKLRTDIRKTGNANYLTETVTDEIKQRGFGPTDRLENEGAYEIVRASLNPEGFVEQGSISFNSTIANALGTDSDKANTQIAGFPSDPVSLRSVNVIETVSNSEQLINSFDGLTITVSNQNVARLNTLKLIKANGNEIIYDIPEHGYILNSNRYDTVHSRPLATLSSNQIRLSESSVVSGTFEEPTGGDSIELNYTYINNGILVDEQNEDNPLAVTKVVQVTRETVGALLTVFSLENFPIVNSAGQSISSGGVQFLDPNGAIPFVSTHPAFRTELAFSSTRLPAGPGEYSINYQTGQVFVYGASSADGTGSVPPVATYKYLKSFIEGVDYNLDTSSDEIVAVPGRDIVGDQVDISFSFETVFEPGVDYVAEVHNEAINEFVENRVTSSFSFQTKNQPITNVFEVFNETTGETYRTSRFTDTEVFISGTQLPRIETISNESVNWTRVSKEDLFITDVISSSSATQLVAAEMSNENIVGETAYHQATPTNTSLSFSNTSLFLREFFFDDVLQTLSTNLAKLTSVGDYTVDYKRGIVYLLTNASQSFDLGEVSYNHAKVQTTRSNILAASGIEYKKNVKSDPIKVIDVSAFDKDSITLSSVDSSIERFLNGNTSKPILLGAVQYGQLGYHTFNSSSFVSGDANFTDDLDDGYHILRIEGEADRTITSVVSSTELEVDVAFDSVGSRLSWCVIDFNPDFPSSDGYKTITTYDISNVRGVYSVTDLQTNDRDSLTNLYDPNLDIVSGNTISFNNANIANISPGTALAIDYSFGTLFANYNYVFDNIRISYEYGDNSIDWAISDALNPGDEYYVTYKYGALRSALRSNFAALTRLGELVNIPLDFDRELYRDFLIGTLQGFVAGPIKESISSLVEQVTSIEPNIRELTFDEWTLGRDNIYLADGEYSSSTQPSPAFEEVKFNNGLIVKDDVTLSFPAEAYLSHREGTFEAWVKPFWNGLDNDASITFSLEDGDGYEPSSGAGLQDGYRLSLSDIYIGSSAFNPEEHPFTINRFDDEPNSPVGRPVNFGAVPGIFIWYSSDDNLWKVGSTIDPSLNTSITGEVTSSGKFYNVKDSDGYSLELSDRITSSKSYVRFAFNLDGYDISDGYDGYTEEDGYFHLDEITFLSDNIHYLVDSGPAEDHNRLSIFKDEAGFLNFRVWDDSARLRPTKAKYYNISHDVSDWSSDDTHHIAASWRLNSAEGIDEMHFFVDGQEVSNVLRFGGKPQSQPGDIYRTVAEETLTSSATKTIIGSTDGVSISGGATFSSEGSTFISDGIVPGDLLYILDSTADGAGSPYTISVVNSETEVTLSTPLTLSLSNISFSLNKSSFNIETNADVEDVAIYTVDGYGTRNELHGVDAVEPDYTITRSAGLTTIEILDNVNAGDQLVINTLGLTQGRCRDTVYKYDTDNTLETRIAPPTNLNHFDVFKVQFPRTSIEQGEAPDFPEDGYFDGYFEVLGKNADGYFTGLCQPSNSVDGKVLSITLGGLDNIDFTGTNSVSIFGSTFAGPPSETISFTEYGTNNTTNRFTSIDYIEMTFSALDGYKSFGSVKISEAFSLTQSEAGGDYADPVAYSNGRVTFFVFGSGGDAFNLEPCFYELDFPIALNIPMRRKGHLFIGSDINGENQWNGAIEQVEFLNEKLSDIRAGEDTDLVRSITQDFNRNTQSSVTPQTLMLLSLNGNISNLERYYKTFDERFQTTSLSVNSNFKDAAVFTDDPFVVDNGNFVFDQNEGTIEFWVAPLIDTLFDESQERYYVDITSIDSTTLVSNSFRTVELNNRAKRINSVRLLNDDGTGVNYFEGGELLKDGTTILLGQSLPGAQTTVRVEYVPIDFNGDRVSIFKDGYGYMNFSITADEELYLIRYPIAWKRNTWHRVMATWRTNTTDNRDRMRMFIDGVESGTITYGTPGLLYGSGVVYGAAAVGSMAADFLLADINLTDTFGEIYIGNSFDYANPSKSKMDNLRFSNIIREPAIVSGVGVDLNYNVNLQAVLPVVEDNLTTALYNFDREVEETEFLSNLLSKFTPLYLFDVEVDDSFRRLETNDIAKDLLRQIIDRMKPAHANVFVKFLQE